MTESTVTGEPTGGARARALAAPETIGLVLGVVLIGVLALTGTLPVVGGPPATAGPGAPSETPSASPSSAGLDPATRSAILAAIAVNGRLSEHVLALEAEVDAEDESGAAIAAILRAMNQDLAVGLRAADPIAGDPPTAALGTELRAFYSAITERSQETLGVSIQDGAAYRAAAGDLLTILAALPAFDDRLADALQGRSAPTAGTPSSAPSPSPSAPRTASPSPSGSPDTPASPSTRPPGPNLVDNGSFDSDLAGWTLQVEPGAVANAAHEPGAGPDGSGAARIEISIGSGARAGIAFVSSPFRLERGQRYEVSAMLRSIETREVRLRVTVGEDRTAAARAFAVGATWSRVTFELTELVAGSASVLAVDLGRGDAPVWIDDVVIAPLG